MGDAMKHTPGPWFVSGVRSRMNGGEWRSVNHYDEATKKDQNVACIGFDPRTGDGLADARLIAAAPDLLAALQRIGELCDEANGAHFLTRNDTTRALARAAIARATGTQQ